MKPTAEQAVQAACEYINEIAPAVPTMTEVAERAARVGCSTTTARKYLRSPDADGKLIELTPSRRFFIDLPGAHKAGIRDVILAAEFTQEGRRVVITRNLEAIRPSTYGPGSTTYMITADQAADLVQTWSDEDKAAQEVERARRVAAEKAERAEIDRRAPGLRTLTRRLDLLLCPDGVYREKGGEARSRLSAGIRSDETPVEDRVLHLDVSAWGSQADVLREILEAGVRAYLDTRPAHTCTNCGERIALFTHDGEQVWWHIANAARRCPDADTTAAPAQAEEATR